MSNNSGVDFSISQYCRTHENINSHSNNSNNNNAVNLLSQHNNSSSLSPNTMKHSPIFNNSSNGLFQQGIISSGKMTSRDREPDTSLLMLCGNGNNNSNNANCGSSNNLKAAADELRRLKSEVESFKTREIKYLVRIASLEKENKRLGDMHSRLEHENKMMKNELCNFSKHSRKMTYTQMPSNNNNATGTCCCGGVGISISGKSANNNNNNANNNNNNSFLLMKDESTSIIGSSSSSSGCTNLINNNLNILQKLDKGVQVCSATKSDQQIAILEEYTRLLKKKMKEIEMQSSAVAANGKQQQQ